MPALAMNALVVLPILTLAALGSFAHEGHDGPHEVHLAAASAEPAASAPTFPQSVITITNEGEFRIIRANGLPGHATGRFPNRGNPHRIQSQNYQFRVPRQPRIAEQPIPLGMQPFGIAVNGVVFDPGAAEWWNNDPNSSWRYEAMSGAVPLGLDAHNAHVQPNGAYHYHGVPAGLIEMLAATNRVALLGWAADGFPIYGPAGYSDPMNTNSPVRELKSSYRVKAGMRPSGPGGVYDGTFVADYEYVKGLGDLDECNGRFGATPEFPGGTFYYVVTDTFPYIPRLFKGSPDESFSRLGDRGGRRPPPGQRGGMRGRPRGDR